MNNAFIALLLFTTAGAVWLSQHVTLLQARQATRVVAAEVDQARSGLEELNRQLAAAQTRLTQHREEMVAAREDLARVAKAAQALEPPLLNPDAEGAWPTTKPYFYLLKKRLREVGYSPCSADKHLGEDAATLFGMSPAERAEVDNGIQTFREAVQQLQDTYAQVQPAPTGKDSATHRELTYQMPTLTNDFSQLELQCEASITAALGQSRSGLFLEQARPLFKATYLPHGNYPFALTLSADRTASGQANHQLILTQDIGAGKNSYYYPVYFPLTPDSPLWDYRHLFGEEPLLGASGD
jgi:hypothetical protein